MVRRLGFDNLTNEEIEEILIKENQLKRKEQTKLVG